MFYIVISALLVGIIVSWINHNRKLPLTILTLGVLVLCGGFTMGFGYATVSILAILAVIIWIANKFDMS